MIARPPGIEMLAQPLQERIEQVAAVGAAGAPGRPAARHVAVLHRKVRQVGHDHDRSGDPRQDATCRRDGTRRPRRGQARPAAACPRRWRLPRCRCRTAMPLPARPTPPARRRCPSRFQARARRSRSRPWTARPESARRYIRSGAGRGERNAGRSLRHQPWLGQNHNPQERRLLPHCAAIVHHARTSRPAKAAATGSSGILRQYLLISPRRQAEVFLLDQGLVGQPRHIARA